MKRMIAILVLCGAGACAADSVEVTSVDQAVASLPSITWLVGSWTCSGEYRTTPATFAHPFAGARFDVRLGIGDRWVIGTYDERAEQSNPLPVSVLDALSFAADGTGIRSFSDSNGGRLQATFKAAPSSDIVWDGNYSIAAPLPGGGFARLQLPYHETLIRRGDSYDLDSQLDFAALGLPPGFLTFQTTTCVREGR